MNAFDPEKSIEKEEVEMVEHADNPQILSTAEPEQEHKVTWKALLVVLAVNLVYVAQLVNVVATGAFASQIASVIGGAGTSVWLAGCVAILTAALGPPVCAASDMFGRKWLLVILTAAGTVGMIIVACSKTMGMAIVGEAIAGVSYGAQPLVHAVPSEILPRKYRPYAQGSVNAASACGGLLALLMGGALMRNDPSRFRIYFGIGFDYKAGIYALAAVLLCALYRPPPYPLQLELTTGEKLRRLDWIGTALFTASLVLFCIGLTWAGNPYPWKNAHVLGPLVGGLGILAVLVLHQGKFKKNGLFHHRLFSMGRNFPLSVICVFIEGLTFFCANGYFAFQVGVMYQSDLLLTTATYSMAFVGFIISSPIAAYVCAKTRTVRPIACLAYLAFLGFYIAMATTGLRSGNAVWGFAAILGIGLGFCLCALMTAAQLTTPRDLIATASGLMISVRSLGGSIGLAAASAAFNSKIETSLGSSIAAAVLPLGLPESSLGPFIGALAAHDNAALAQVPGVTLPIIQAGVTGLRLGFHQGFKVVWIMGASFAAVGLICSAWLKDPRDQYTNAVDAPIEKQAAIESPA